MLELATHIVVSKAGHFEPERFEDQYEDSLKELLKKKQSGEKIEAPREREPSKVINLMDALRRSVETERGAENDASPHRGPAIIAPRRRQDGLARGRRRQAELTGGAKRRSCLISTIPAFSSKRCSQTLGQDRAEVK
jgi:hypothetical protein